MTTATLSPSPAFPILVAAQQRVARTEGVAFLHTFAAMGGMGTMARWYDEHPRLVTGDFTHPTYTGAQQLGTMLVNALLKGFDEYKKDPGAPCALPAVAPEGTEATKENSIDPDQNDQRSCAGNPAIESTTSILRRPKPLPPAPRPSLDLLRRPR